MENKARFCKNNFITTGNATFVGTSLGGGQNSMSLTEESLIGDRTDPITFDRFVFVNDSGSGQPRRGPLFKTASGDASILSSSVPRSTIFTTIAVNLQSEIQGSFDAGATVSYDQNTGFFTFNFTSPTTIEFSDAVDSAWDILGFNRTQDVTVTSIISDEPRFVGRRELRFQFLTSLRPTTVAILNEVGTESIYSDEAFLRVQHASDNAFTTITYEKIIPRSRQGFIGDLDDESNLGSRFWRVFIEDEQNPNLLPDPGTVQNGFLTTFYYLAHYLYLGDHLEIPRGITNGFSVQYRDLSEKVQSASGVIYSNKRVKLKSFSNLGFSTLLKKDVDAIEEFILEAGTTEKFLVVLDPKAYASDNLSNLSAICTFPNLPSIDHVVKDFYDVSFVLEESL